MRRAAHPIFLGLLLLSHFGMGGSKGRFCVLSSNPNIFLSQTLFALLSLESVGWWFESCLSSRWKRRKREKNPVFFSCLIFFSEASYYQVIQCYAFAFLWVNSGERLPIGCENWAFQSLLLFCIRNSIYGCLFWFPYVYICLISKEKISDLWFAATLCENPVSW